jgi:hypothetical protein
MPKATGGNGKQNAPNTHSNRSVARRHLPGYERCWCRGYNVGCGLVESLRTRQKHALKERTIREGKYDTYYAILMSDRSPYNFQSVKHGFRENFSEVSLTDSIMKNVRRYSQSRKTQESLWTTLTY